MIRTTLEEVAHQVRMAMSRGTVREFDDNHLLQQVKTADIHHSETHSDFERWQMVGITATPLKQDEDTTQQHDRADRAKEQGDWNHNQPKGKAAEAVMLYLGGTRSHPIAIVDDRRVRPYKVPEGASALYAATGTGQLFYHNDKGSYVVAVNNPAYNKKDQTERFASLRHVEKQPQSREIQNNSQQSGQQQQQQQEQEYKHEGETVNIEVRCTKTRIEFRDGDTVVGYYDKSAKRWAFIGDVIRLGSDDAEDPVYGKNKISGKGQLDPKVFVKTTQPGPPTSLDTMP